jgi:hypothetical protein
MAKHVNQWLEQPGKMAARLAKVYSDGPLRVTIEGEGATRIVFSVAGLEARHSLALSVSSTFRILHHLGGFAETCGIKGADLYKGGSFYVASDQLGRDQLVEVLDYTEVGSSQGRRGEPGAYVGIRTHYKTRKPGKRVATWHAKRWDL